ncbi:MAG: sensor histidine kinase [Salinigranum sp.]
MATRAADVFPIRGLRWSFPVGCGLFGALLVALVATRVDALWLQVASIAVPGTGLATLGVLGVRMAREDDNRVATRTVLWWAAAGLGLTLAATVWYRLVGVLSAHQVPLLLSTLETLSVGTALGAAVGYHSAGRRRRSADGARAAARRHTLDRQRDATDLLDRAVRHSLLNSLNVVLAHADVAREHVSPDGERHVETIRSRAEEMVETMTRLRQMAESLHGGSELKPVDLREVVDAEVRTLRRSYPGVSVRAAVPEDVAVRANHQLPVALRNVLENAVRHSGSDEPRVAVEARVRGDRAVLAVADDGPGIPDERKDRVFEMGERDLAGDGTGMGLFLARSIVERFGGSIRIEDNEPTGTVVSISLGRADT